MLPPCLRWGNGEIKKLSHRGRSARCGPEFILEKASSNHSKKARRKILDGSSSQDEGHRGKTKT